MFLSVLKKRNPALIRAALALHRDNVIPANTWLMDLDAIEHNAEHLVKAKKQTGLETYLMSKQYNRNPIINHLAIKKGLGSTVCVDVQCARAMGRWQLPVGHVGHLNQIPRGDISYVLGLRPEVWTLYSLENARYLNEAASSMGLKQNILLRVYKPGDVFFSGQEGGFPLDSLHQIMPEILKLNNLRVVGVTSFPCYLYSYNPEIPAKPAPNLETILQAAEILRNQYGLEITQINAPGNTSAATFPLLKKHGATHVEPGHGLTGTTPNHVFLEDLPEIPAYCYVSEITHKYEGMAYAHGGGLFIDSVIPGFTYRAAVGRDDSSIMQTELVWNRINQIIDYHIQLEDASRCEVGDTVVTCDRTQMQMTRSWIAVVSGISENKPHLAGLFDHAGHMLDEITREALPIQDALAKVANIQQNIEN